MTLQVWNRRLGALPIIRLACYKEQRRLLFFFLGKGEEGLPFVVT